MDLSLGKWNVVDLGALRLPKTATFNVNAVPGDATVKSVLFTSSTKTTQKETSLPWAYCGNVAGVYKACSDLKIGATVNITVIPYPVKNQGGTPFPAIWAVIRIVEGTRAPSPAPVLDTDYPEILNKAVQLAPTGAVDVTWNNVDVKIQLEVRDLSGDSSGARAVSHN
jgi:hypothetical protein